MERSETQLEAMLWKWRWEKRASDSVARWPSLLGAGGYVVDLCWRLKQGIVCNVCRYRIALFVKVVDICQNECSSFKGFSTNALAFFLDFSDWTQTVNWRFINRFYMYNLHVYVKVKVQLLRNSFPKLFPLIWSQYDNQSSRQKPF